MKYRSGPVGALLDIYESEIEKLNQIILNNYKVIPETEETDSWDLRKILNHVLRAGFAYTKDIRDTWGGSDVEHQTTFQYKSPEEYVHHTKAMFDSMRISLDDKHEHNSDYIKKTYPTSWGQNYDLEQTVEHAIVHVMRHARQLRRSLDNQ